MNATYQVALNGLTKNSFTNNHVFAVICVSDSSVFIADLTRDEAEAKAATLNLKR
jgi:hypothetical protein